MKKYSILFCIFLLGLIVHGQSKISKNNANNCPQAYGPVPTPAQLAWQKMEMNMFCHFGPNTFTGLEWGAGTEHVDIFKPTALDCNQWVSVAKQGGFAGIIITAKHHDGFCLWPNPMSTHTLRESSWRDGKGDILLELSEACKNGGIKFGIYISPWDRNAPTYGTKAYNKVFIKTLNHAHSNYGEIFEQWFDGANGEGPNGKKQIYDWKKFNLQTLKKQPNAVIFSDIGPGCRWVGNEEGRSGRTCWSRLEVKGFGPGLDAPSQDTLNCGNYNGESWVPAETDVSIRKGWFWRESEHPKSLQELLKIYYNSVGRNSLLLLNVPPDTRGLIPSEDSLRLIEFRSSIELIFADNLAKKAKMIKASNVRSCGSTDYYKTQNFYDPHRMVDDDYDTYWATDDSVYTAWVELQFDSLQTFNRVMLQEYIPLGQRVASFSIEIEQPNGEWKTIAKETTIGYKRILLCETCTTKKVRLMIDKSRACAIINYLGLFLDEIYSE